MNKLPDFKPGKLTLLKEFRENNRTWCTFKCYCGKIFTCRRDTYRAGNVRSCGCYTKEVKRRELYKHGEAKTPLHEFYCSMLERCSPNSKHYYENYAARGIRVCDEWKKDYLKFKDWALNNGYKKGLTLDRKNNDGNYEPDNCRWTTNKVQMINKRYRKNKTGYAGVSFEGKRFKANISIDRIHYHLGVFDTAEEAHKAYLEAKKVRDSKYLKEAGND